MKLQRFFLTQSVEDNTKLAIPSLELLNQLKSVLRLSPGDEVTLFDNTGYDFLATIEGYTQDGVSFNILEKKENTVRPERETYLFASIVKKDNFEWISEKATELGVAHIIPIISNRTEKKDINRERLTKIIIEASEQSGRATLPVLHEVVDLMEALSMYAEIKSIVWHPGATKFSPADMQDVLGSYIGPEGGWSEDELELMRTKGIHVRSLGSQVLRTETAVIAVLSRLVF